MDLQLSAQNTEGVRLALNNQIERVELSCALDLGGLTPSLGSVEQAVEIGLPIHVLIRPRPGNFCYSDEEFAVIRRDVEIALDCGAAAVAVGALREDNHLNMAVLEPLAESIHNRMGIEMNLNRCVDAALRAGVSPEEIVEQSTKLGCARINSSGGAFKAVDGLPTLSHLQELWKDKGIVQVTGGVTFPDLPVIAAHGLAAVQLSARKRNTAESRKTDDIAEDKFGIDKPEFFCAVGFTVA